MSEYIKKDWPSKALILVLGVMLGGMLGTGIVLVNYSIANYRHGQGKVISPVI